MIRLLFISLLFISCKGNTTEIAKLNTLNYQVQVKQVQQDTLLKGIQSEIYNAFLQSLMSKYNKPLTLILREV